MPVFYSTMNIILSPVRLVNSPSVGVIEESQVRIPEWSLMFASFLFTFSIKINFIKHRTPAANVITIEWPTWFISSKSPQGILGDSKVSAMFLERKWQVPEISLRRLSISFYHSHLSLFHGKNWHITEDVTLVTTLEFINFILKNYSLLLYLAILYSGNFYLWLYYLSRPWNTLVICSRVRLLQDFIYSLFKDEFSTLQLFVFQCSEHLIGSKYRLFANL